MRKRKQLSKEQAPNSTPLERYLGRTRGEDGKLVPKPARKPRNTVSASVFGKTMHETREMIESRDFSTCAARHLVALHEIMHLKTYGVPSGMTSSERHKAGLRMGMFVKRQFEGNIMGAVAYFRWLWTREIGREQWRRQEGRTDGMCVGFGLAISSTMLSQYRISLVRARHAGGKASS